VSRGRILAVGVLALAAFASVSPAAPTQEMSLEIQRLPDGRVRFSGRIPSGQANEYVTVLARRCGQQSFTAFTGSSTDDGGLWHVDAFNPGNGVFRARWNNVQSNAITISAPAPVQMNLTKLPRNRFRLWVFADANLAGKFVALQRLASGRWTHVRRQRLATGGVRGFGGRFETTFVVRKRGLRLRVVVPQQAVAPCYAAATTETFRS
jgi:hypothetical protein